MGWYPLRPSKLTVILSIRKITYVLFFLLALQLAGAQLSPVIGYVWLTQDLAFHFLGEPRDFIAEALPNDYYSFKAQW